MISSDDDTGVGGGGEPIGSPEPLVITSPPPRTKESGEISGYDNMRRTCLCVYLLEIFRDHYHTISTRDTPVK